MLTALVAMSSIAAAVGCVVDLPAADPVADAAGAQDEAEDGLVFAATFADIGESWARDLIQALAADALVGGYPDGSYRPNRHITRAELAAMLSAAFPTCTPIHARRDFPDVPASHWAHGAVDRVQRCGIMSGYPDGRFGPARNTTRLEAIVAIHGALRGRASTVGQRAAAIEGWSAGARAAAVGERYFDAGRIPAWSHAALLSATEAGMVILGEDRVGVDRGVRRVLSHDDPATRADVAALLYGAVNHPRGYDLGDNPRPGPGGSFRAAPYRGGALLDGEWVLTFDDGPRASSVQLARTLRAKGVTGLFFAVTHAIGWADANGVQLNPSTQPHIQGVLAEGHVVANHTHRHCIHGASCNGRGLAELPGGELAYELETAHQVLRAAIAHAGYRPADKMLHFFRAPGSQDGTSWSAAAAAHASTARLPGNYVGTVAWDLPGNGHDISECWNRGLSGAQCAARYLELIDRGGLRRGVILIHDNFAQAADMVGPLIDGLSARGMRVVHPRCIVGCTR